MTSSHAPQKPSPSPSEMERALQLTREPGQVIELRALGVRINGYRHPSTVSGFFDDPNKLIKCATSIPASPNSGVYVVLNPVKTALLSRAYNHIQPAERDSLTSDGDILGRRWLLIDADPVRPSKVSSTDEEHDAALTRAIEIRDALRKRGWPDPIFADSGNGAHLLYRIDLPTDDGGLVKRCLGALAFQFDSGEVKIDQGNFNPSRACKLYGTLSCKGDDTPERPHRMARILEAPDQLTPVDPSLLEALAQTVPVPPSTTRGRRPSKGFDVDKWLAKHNITVDGPTDWNGGKRWILPECPFNPDHKRSAYIAQYPSGGIAAGCHHTSCDGNNRNGNGWQALRDLLEPNRNKPVAGQGSAASVKDYHHTDLGNAERLIESHGEKLLYCGKRNAWFTWDGCRWKLDDTREIDRLANETIRAAFAEGGTISDTEEQKKFFKFLIASERHVALNNMVQRARSLAHCVDPAELDADPWVLNCPNGVVDLRNGTLLSHSRDRLITKLAGAAYRPGTPCPTFLRFLARIMGDHPGASLSERESAERMVRYFQKCFGYAASGSVSEKVVFVLYGRGNNGKTTLLEIIREALGEYAGRLLVDTLMTRHMDNTSNTDIADLCGKRFVTTSECDEDHRLAMARLKHLSGMDRIKACRKYENPFEFSPTHKIFIDSNYKPAVRGTEEATWSRLRCIPFPVILPEAERDKSLSAKLCAELDGILAWIVEGALLWQQEGLGMPPEVEAATDEYKQESDPLTEFLEDRCVIDPSESVAAGDLYRAYLAWTEDVGERFPITKKRFGQLLKDRGFTPYSTGRTRLWRGINLLSRP